MSEISGFKLVSVAEQAGLNLILSEILKTDFLMARLNCNTYVLNQCMHNINPTVNSGIFTRVLRSFAIVNHALVVIFIVTNILLPLFAKIKFL